MPVAKKAAKHAAKRAAKKAPKKAAKKAAKKAPSHSGHHLRRAYEHIGRVRTLHLGLPGAALEQVDTLTRLAQAAVMCGDAQSAADLLRAAEHAAFGALSSTSGDDTLNPVLIDAAREEYERLRERAADHAPGTGKALMEIRGLYNKLLKDAAEAFAQRRFDRALEYARGAEALTHVEAPGQPRLESNSALLLPLR